jgi:hypothetical protein
MGAGLAADQSPAPVLRLRMRRAIPTLLPFGKYKRGIMAPLGKLLWYSKECRTAVSETLVYVIITCSDNRQCISVCYIVSMETNLCRKQLTRVSLNYYYYYLFGTKTLSLKHIL